MRNGQNGAEDDFLDGLGNNGETDPFDGEPEDLFPEEAGDVTEKETVAKAIPFHKDEKVQRFIDRQVEKRLKDFKPNAQQTFAKEVNESGDDEMVKVLTRLVGNDTEEKRTILNDFKSALDKRDERASQKAYERLQQVQEEQSTREQQEIEEAHDELEEGRQEIESHLGADLTDRQWNAYKDFLSKIEPRDGYVEYPDFVKTFDVFKKSIKRPSNDQAKALASRGMQRSSSSNTDTGDTFLKKVGNESLFERFERMRNK